MKDIDAKYMSGACCTSASNCGIEPPPNGMSMPNLVCKAASYVDRADFMLSGATVNDIYGQPASFSASGTGAVRVRIINMSAYSSFFIYISDQSIDLEVIEVDGVPLQTTGARTAKSLEIHPGQRYSVRIVSSKSYRLYGVLGECRCLFHAQTRRE
jgi:iron transport multicopper oxidase